MFFNELKVLLLMRSGSSRRTDTDPNTQTTMRGLAIGGCDWPQLRCSQRDDEEEYYGSDLRPRSLAFEDKEGAKPQGGGVGNMDAASLPSLSESGTRSPQCRICFQGPEKVKLEKKKVLVLEEQTQLESLAVACSWCFSLITWRDCLKTSCSEKFPPDTWRTFA